MKRSKVLLIIRDGWGNAKADRYNAVANAETPNMDKFLKKYPHSILFPSGEEVGLPKGYQGSSEVGHLNMGAGRIVVQELKKIKDMIEDGSLFKCRALEKAFDNAVEKGSALHLMGLVQDEGVHAHQDHLYALVREAKRRGVKKVWVHFFSDGRDTPPRSALSFVKMLEPVLKEAGNASIGTLMGRYYAMDRGAKWQLTDLAYKTLTEGAGKVMPDITEAINNAYATLKNPNGQPVSDEYIPPTVFTGYDGIKDGDSVVHFNFRQDRAIQLTRAFVEDDYPGKRDIIYNIDGKGDENPDRPSITYCGMSEYYTGFRFSALPSMADSGGMDNLLGQVISDNGLRQLRLAETQKFKHVTSFFNGKSTKPYPNEDQVEIKGTFDPSSFGEHPQMNAPEVCAEAVKRISSEKYDFVLVNFANCDMVGHTGIYEAAVKAVEITDKYTGILTETALEHGYTVMITSDHGNAEEMWDYGINMPKTSHTTNPVDFILIKDGEPEIKLAGSAVLSAVAPTVLQTMGLPVPADMTTKSLLL